MTFLKDLDDLIKYHHGDVRKLREIRNTIRHDNFITTEDKNYVQSLVDEHLNGQPLEGSYTSKKADTRIKLQTRSKDRVSGQQTRSAFNFFIKSYSSSLFFNVNGDLKSILSVSDIP